MLNKKATILLYGSNLWSFGAGMFGPLFSVFAQEVGGNVLDISWAWAAYLIVTGILTLLLGRISDNLGKEKLLILGFFLNAVFTFGYLLVSQPIHLLLVQMGMGVASALVGATWSPLYAKYEDRVHAGFVWGLANGEALIISGVAMVVGGFIVSYYSFTALFIGMGVIRLVATAYQAKILRS